MIRTRALVIGAGIVCLTVGLHGQGVTQYRNFTLKADVASVAKLAGIDSSDARTIHQRPAVMQNLEWRPSRWSTGSVAPNTDPVEQIGFGFYNDQLFKILVDYDPDRTLGMTDADMISAITVVYGASLPRAAGAARVGSTVETESGTPLARWGDAGHSVVLYRTTSYRGAFRLIVTETALDDLARKATIQAVRLDDQEAPLREIARQKKEKDDASAAADKARVANKDGFRP